MYKFFGMNFFNFVSEWFYDWPVVMVDIMNQKWNMNDMFFTEKINKNQFTIYNVLNDFYCTFIIIVIFTIIKKRECSEPLNNF